MRNIIWLALGRTVPLALAGASGVLMVFDWQSIAVLCAIGATYALNRLIDQSRLGR